MIPISFYKGKDYFSAKELQEAIMESLIYDFDVPNYWILPESFEPLSDECIQEICKVVNIPLCFLPLNKK